MTERHAVDQQAEQHEQPLILTFLEWVAALKIVELLRMRPLPRRHAAVRAQPAHSYRGNTPQRR